MGQFKNIKPMSKPRISISVIVGLAISVMTGFVVFYEITRDCKYNCDTVSEIEATEREISQITSNVQENDITWNDIGRIGYTLNNKNKDIAIAKLFVNFKSKPNKLQKGLLGKDIFDEVSLGKNSVDVYFINKLWENRNELSRKSWDVYDPDSVLLKSILYGSMSVIISVPSVWIALLVISLFWYFILERITELSMAIRSR